MKTLVKELTSNKVSKGTFEFVTFETTGDAQELLGDPQIVDLMNRSYVILQMNGGRIYATKNVDATQEEIQAAIDKARESFDTGIRTRGATVITPQRAVTSLKEMFMREAKGDEKLAQKMFLKYLQDNGMLTLS